MGNPFRKMDGNQLAKSEHAHRQFAQQFSLGAVRLLDRFNRPIEKGAYVLWRPPAQFDPLYQVVDVAPILDPLQPPGFVRVLLSMNVPFQAHVSGPASELIVVGHQRAPGHSEIDGPQPQAPPTPIELPTGDEPPRATRQDAALDPTDVDPRD